MIHSQFSRYVDLMLHFQIYYEGVCCDKFDLLDHLRYRLLLIIAFVVDTFISLCLP